MSLTRYDYSLCKSKRSKGDYFQVIQLSATIVYCTLKSIHYIAGTSIDNVFRSHLACFVEYTAFLGIIVNQCLGSLTIAIYRFVSLKFTRFTLNSLGPWRLAFCLTSAYLLTLSWMVSVALYMVQNRLYADQLELCRCRGKDYAEIANRRMGATDESHQRSKRNQGIAMLLLILFNAMELLCYIVIFTDRYANDKRMVGKLKPEVIQTRVRGSTLTVSSQLLMFGIEICFQAFVVFRNVITRSDPSRSTDHIPTLVSMNLVVMVSTLSLTALVSSPELRRHYLRTHF